MNNEELEEKKKWFFKENIRLEELRKNLEQQQGKLEEEEQVVIRSICLTSSGRFWNGKPDSLLLTAKNLSATS